MRGFLYGPIMEIQWLTLSHMISVCATCTLCWFIRFDYIKNVQPFPTRFHTIINNKEWVQGIFCQIEILLQVLHTSSIKNIKIEKKIEAQNSKSEKIVKKQTRKYLSTEKQRKNRSTKFKSEKIVKKQTRKYLSTEKQRKNRT